MKNLLLLLVYLTSANILISQNTLKSVVILESIEITDTFDIEYTKKIKVPIYSRIELTDFKNSNFKKLKYKDLFWYTKSGFKYTSEEDVKTSTEDYKNNSSSKSSYKSSSSTYKSSECSSTQCVSYTKKGRRCQNMTKNCSGRCHQH